MARIRAAFEGWYPRFCGVGSKDFIFNFMKKYIPEMPGVKLK
jgi:hypothetical protein